MTSISPSLREVVRTGGKCDKLKRISYGYFVTGLCYFCLKQYVTVMYNLELRGGHSQLPAIVLLLFNFIA